MRYGKDLCARGPVLCALSQETAKEQSGLWTVHSWYRARLCSAYSQRQHREACAIEGALQGQELVENDTKTPNIGLEVVRVVLTQLRRHTLGSADASHCAKLSFGEHLGHAKIAKLHDPAARQEHVLALHISVQDTEIMDMPEGQRKLSEDGHGLPFVVSPGSFAATCDGSREVTTVSVLHNNAKVGIGHEGIVIAYDIGMPQGLQNLGLPKRFATPARHVLIRSTKEVDNLHHSQVTDGTASSSRWSQPDKDASAKGATAQHADGLVPPPSCSQEGAI